MYGMCKSKQFNYGAKEITILSSKTSAAINIFGNVAFQMQGHGEPGLTVQWDRLEVCLESGVGTDKTDISQAHDGQLVAFKQL